MIFSRADMDLQNRAGLPIFPWMVSTQAIRLYPRYQGWGHQLGEVEFWVYDNGYFDAEVTGLGQVRTTTEVS